MRKSTKALIALACSLAASGGAFAFATGASSASVAEARHRASAAANALDSLKASRAAAGNASVEEASGAGLERKKADDEAARGELSAVLTWSDRASYEARRARLAKEHGAAEDSQLLTAFMPASKETYDTAGRLTNDVDMYGLNMAFEKLDSRVVGVEGETYSYVGEAEVSSKAPNGAQASRKVLVEYKVDGSGAVRISAAHAAGK